MKYFPFILTLLIGFCGYAQPSSDVGMSFTGSNSYNGIPNTVYINRADLLSNRTIELSFKAVEVTSRQVLYEEGAEYNAMLLYIENGYLVVGVLINEGNGPNEAIFFRKSISVDTWYHVALVLDDGSALRWYLNGVLEDTDNNAFEIPDHSGAVNLGRSDGGLRYPNCGTWINDKCEDNTARDANNNYFEGLIWGFRIWNSVRTQTEIDTNKSTIISDETDPDLAAYMPDTNEKIRYRDDDGNFADALGTGVTGITLSVKDYNYLAKEVKIYAHNNVLFIKSNLDYKINRVRIFSNLGNEVFSTPFEEEIQLPTFSKSVYLMIFELENGISFSKKIIL